MLIKHQENYMDDERGWRGDKFGNKTIGYDGNNRDDIRG
jgi:hypothetical protein